MSLSRKLNCVGWGALTGLNGFLAARSLLDYTNARAVAIQTQLARAPELTEQAYEAANNAAERAFSGQYYLGLTCALFTGFSLGFTLYYANKEE